MPRFGVADAYKISMVGPGEKYKCHTHWIASKLYFLFAFKCPGGKWADLKLTELFHCSYSTTGNPTEFSGPKNTAEFDVNQEAFLLHQISIFKTRRLTNVKAALF